MTKPIESTVKKALESVEEMKERREKKNSRYPALVSVRTVRETLAKFGRIADRLRVDPATVLRWVLDDVPEDYVPSFLKKPVSIPETAYYSTKIPELDKVLNGGLLYGKTLLFRSFRGTGASTLALQACNGFAQEGRKAYFATGEMSSNAVIEYAERLGIVNNDVLLFGDPNGLDIERLIEDVVSCGAKFLVIDCLSVSSISDVQCDIGRLPMIEAVVSMVTSFAQKERISVMLISHNEAGGIYADYAGSERVRHLVDGLLKIDVKLVCGKDIGLREISMVEHSRRGRSGDTAFVEMTDKGVQSPSAETLKALARLSK